jgi:hypothetical protein
VGFVVDKVALGQVFCEYFGFPCQSSFHQLLHNHPTSNKKTCFCIRERADAQSINLVPSALVLACAQLDSGIAQQQKQNKCCPVLRIQLSSVKPSIKNNLYRKKGKTSSHTENFGFRIHEMYLSLNMSS